MWCKDGHTKRLEISQSYSRSLQHSHVELHNDMRRSLLSGPFEALCEPESLAMNCIVTQLTWLVEMNVSFCLSVSLKVPQSLLPAVESRYKLFLMLLL